MWTFSIGTTCKLLWQTTPFLALRFAIYFGIALACGVMAVAAGWLAPKVLGVTWLTFVVVGVCMVMPCVLGYWAREYLLYLIKAGHIAVMVKGLAGEPLPEGQGQLRYARGIVQQHFGQSSALFAVDQLIKGVLAAINGTLLRVAAWLPLPGLDALMGFATRVLRRSLTYVDEVMLAHHLRQRSDNPWASSRDALILYAQNYTTLVKNAAVLVVLMWCAQVVIFVLVLGPLLATAALFPGIGSLLAAIMAVVVAYCVKLAVLEPFAIAALLQAFIKATEGQTPDPEWQQKLSGWSTQFRTLVARAYENRARKPATAEEPPALAAGEVRAG